ncbi:carbohydrate kinase family protein [Ectothiorhodospiraceae bacterium BW-2]|nr:carbohydrate kinase family protein [Ectothiorhodospiraceae bacterium BW-2]
MPALICGSVAYDTIMVFEDQFKNHILSESVHILNVSFLVPKLRRENGGCAGNIGYNLKLLGEEPYIMATVGVDFISYAEHLKRCGIDQRYIRELPTAYTAQAFITTDIDDNQITAFHPGAMSFSHYNRISDASDSAITLGIVSPDGREGMLEHAQQFNEAEIPFIFDPGQGMPMFDGKELNHFIDQAEWIALNDYESQLLQQKCGDSLADIAARVTTLVVTKGAEGAEIYHNGDSLLIPAALTNEINDPTGCGDAYRAGLLYGIDHRLDWQQIGELAAVMGALKVEHHGTQNHTPSLDDIRQRCQESFGESII